MNASDVFLSKVLLLGNSAVGKTSISLRYSGRRFVNSYNITLGAEYIFYDQPVFLENQDIVVRFQIWDLSGQERFSGIRNLYYTGAMGAVIVYDVTRPSTFHDIDKWVSEMLENLGNNNIPPLIFVGNKVDIREKSPESVQTDEGENKAKEIQQKLGVSTHFFETSALSGENIQLLFKQLAQTIVKHAQASESAREVTLPVMRTNIQLD
ncbi:MAG: Rab family GTPase [Candidatus Odinarchaeota archaeon]